MSSQEKEAQTWTRSAKDARNAAANCKRLASGLQQLVAPCSPGVDDQERQTLVRAAQILWQLSESLDKEKRRAQVREAREANRQKEMRAALARGDFGTLRKVEDRVAFIGHSSGYRDGRAEIDVGIGEEPRWAMRRLEDEFGRALTRHAQILASGDASVSETVTQAWKDFLEKAADLKRRNARVIEVLEKLEAIA